MTEASGGSTSKIITFGPELFGLKGGIEIEEKEGKKEITKFGTLFEKGGEKHFVTSFNPTLEFESRKIALISLTLSPIWISIRAIFSVVASLANIATGGLFSVVQDFVDFSRKGCAKSMGCSLLSLLTTPVNMVVEELAIATHVFVPKLNKIDLLAAHMWTGFVVASRQEKKPNEPVKPNEHVVGVD